jgi:hypothetical protein
MERDHPRQAPASLDGLVRGARHGAHPFQARTIHAGWDDGLQLVDMVISTTPSPCHDFWVMCAGTNCWRGLCVTRALVLDH